MFCSPGSIAFSFLNIDVHWYGIIMSLSILLGLFVILKIKNKFFQEISEDNIFDISFIMIIVGLISARIYYVLVDWQYFYKHPFEIPAIWNGGISIQGAILGCVIAFIYYSKKRKLDFFRYADLFVFGLVTGQIIGRWGNFFNSEAFGLPTNVAWKLYIPYASRPLEYKLFDFFHPTFLYESICNVIILIVLFLILAKLKNRKNGVIFFSYVILYSLARIIVENIRIDSVLNIYGIPIAQITAFVFIIISLIGIYFLYSKDKSTSL